jgi:hypothetical protein
MSAKQEEMIDLKATNLVVYHDGVVWVGGDVETEMEGEDFQEVFDAFLDKNKQYILCELPLI